MDAGMTASVETELVFLAALNKHGRKLKAAKTAGVTAQWYRDKAKREPEFARKMALATMRLAERIEDVQIVALLEGDVHEVQTMDGVLELRKPAPIQLRLKYLEQFCPGWSGQPKEAFDQAKELVLMGDVSGLSIKQLIQGSLVAGGADLTPDNERDEEEEDGFES